MGNRIFAGFMIPICVIADSIYIALLIIPVLTYCVFVKLKYNRSFKETVMLFVNPIYEKLKYIYSTLFNFVFKGEGL